MKQHLISGVVAAAIAGGIGLYMPPKVTQVTHQIAVSKHAWPDLTKPQKADLARALADFPKSVKIDIVCNDGGCSDLAADIDDACEDAGIESVIDKAIGPLGYGVGVQVNEFDRPAADAFITALASATDLKPQIVAGKSPAGYITLLIGKRPR